MNCWIIEKRMLERIFKGVTKRKTKIIDIPADEEGIGYTSKDGNIHLKKDDVIMDGLNEKEKKFFRLGVFAHEMLHQIFSNFDILEKRIDALPDEEKQIYSMFSNLIEDPAIEYMASSVIGGSVLKGLKFSIRYIYEKSGLLEESSSAFSQYINALVQFGDMGLIKGKFTYDKASEIFAKTVHLFNTGVESSNPDKRADIAYEIMQIAKPLWEKDAKAYKDAMEAMEKLGKKNLSSGGSGGKGIEITSSDDAKSKSRKEIAKKIATKTDIKSKKERSSEDKILSSKHVTEEKDPLPDDKKEKTVEDKSFSVEETAEEDKTSKDALKKEDSLLKDEGDEFLEDESFSMEETSKEDDSIKEDTSKKGESTEDFSDKGEEDLEDESFSMEETSKEDDSIKEDTSKEGEPTEDFSDKGEEDLRTENFSETKSETDSILDDINDILKKEVEDKEDIDDDTEITEKDISWYDASEKMAKHDMDKETSDKEEIPVDDSIKERFYESRGKHYSVYNTSIKIDSFSISYYQDAYNTLLAKYASSINSFTKRLKKIFQNDVMKKEHRKSGKVNIKRLYGSRKTARVFDKRKSPKDIDDIAIAILIDESGSMRNIEKTSKGEKPRYLIAQESAIALTEAFAKLNIPTYVMGFSGEQYCAADHFHYIKWKNTLHERLKLLQIKDRYQNFDSYSISFIAEILKKRKAKHKLLIIISDGEPFCSFVSHKQGIKDTKEVIRQTRKFADVLGIAIGNDSTKTLQYMYGKHFLHVADVDKAFVDISKEISSMIKTW